MSFLELAADRFSVRSFAEKEIEPEKLDAIYKAAQLAPTACNYQPQMIYLLRSPQAMEKARSVTKYMFNAPMAFLLCVDDDKVWHSPWEQGYDTGDIDVSIVCTHMMLEAWELGIGSCWVRGFDAPAVQKTFGLPANIKPVCLLPIGYPAENARPASRHSATREISEFIQEL